MNNGQSNSLYELCVDASPSAQPRCVPRSCRFCNVNWLLITTSLLLVTAIEFGVPNVVQAADDPVAAAPEENDDAPGLNARGVSIALTGMTIVFVALALISVFIEALPRVLSVVARVFPVADEPRAQDGHTDSLIPEDDAVLAAIGFVLHTEMQKQAMANQESVG